MGEDKRRSLEIAEADVAFIQSVEAFSDEVIAEERENFHSDLESFDAHAEKIRLAISKNMEEFRTHFLKGYEVLLDELSHIHPKEIGAGSPPPNAIKL